MVEHDRIHKMYRCPFVCWCSGWWAEWDMSFRDFSHSLESIRKLVLGVENVGLKKVSVSVWKIFGLKKSLSIGLENFGLKKVSVSVSKKVLAMLISFSKEIQVILLMILSHKEFQYQSQKFWSNYWSWYIAKGTKAKALRTLTHSTPLVQSRSSNKLWNLDQTFAYFFLAKGEKYIEHWQIHVTT